MMQKKLDRLNNGIQEVLTNVRVVKSFVREDYECKKFKEMNADLKESSLKAMRIVIATMPVMMLAMNVTTVAVVWYGGRRFDGIYHIYSTDSDVADDAVNGVFTEFPSHGLSKENQ